MIQQGHCQVLLVKFNERYEKKTNLADLYFHKSLYFSFIKTLSGFEPLPCTSLLECRPAPQLFEPLKSSKDSVSRGFLVPLSFSWYRLCQNSMIIRLNYSTGSLLTNVSEM